MNPTPRRLMTTWIVGVVLGTSLIAITSPLFVRSYVPLEANSVRGVWTLPAGHHYRWRSEGYADTQIGPLGMPGKTTLGENIRPAISVALWGDSQTEGVCVDDNDKIFAQAERLFAHDGSLKLNVYPLARSGEDAADWVTQMPRVEDELSIDVHVLMIVDLPDLVAATEAPLPPPSDADIEQANAAIAARVPAFVIQAARNLLTEGDNVTRRRLRFSIGPVKHDPPQRSGGKPDSVDWQPVMEAIAAASERPIVILYVPKAPRILGGRVINDDPEAREFLRMRSAAEAVGLIVIDTAQLLRHSAAEGHWPHGFHNGYIGQGHLNATGNALVAEQLVEVIQSGISLREITTADPSRRTDFSPLPPQDTTD